jgi:hypothetical protein
MKEHGIDGVFLQRFGNSLKRDSHLNHRNTVMANVQAGAKEHGRTWAIMYDLSGLRKGDIDEVIMQDWKRLRNQHKIVDDPRYLRHNGKPVVAVWGVGFSDNRHYTLDECARLVRFLKDNPEFGGMTVMLGVPTGWRTLDGDALKDKKLHDIIRRADIISPWMVGRYDSPSAASRHGRNRMAPDITWATEKKLDYLPVIFPGFSWHNMKRVKGEKAKLDQIPRLNGKFLWSQAVSAKRQGAKMLYVAMFDEIDEGTAIFKCTNKPPVGASPFLTYGGLRTDHYLWLTGQAGKLLRGEIPAAEKMPERTFE